MPQRIQAMKGEGPGQDGLEPDLGDHGPGRERRGQRGRLEVPAEQGRDEIGGAEEVEEPGQADAGDAVEAGHVPRDLRAVDAQVWRDGAVPALRGQDGVGGGGGDGSC
jgi:hypothetical protein